MDFYSSWQYLNHLDMVYYNGVNRFDMCLCVDVVKVNPITKCIDDDKKLNTKTEVWLEFGKVIYDSELELLTTEHDYDFDCCGDTFEEAIINLAKLVKMKYK